MSTIPIDQISSVWLVLFAGITACSPILVAIITKKWGKSVGKATDTDKPELAWREHNEHEQTRNLVRDQSHELRSRLERIHDIMLIDRAGRS